MSRSEPSLDAPSPFTEFVLWMLLGALVASVIAFGLRYQGAGTEPGPPAEESLELLAQLDRVWHLLGAAQAERIYELSSDAGRLDEARALLGEMEASAPKHPKVHFYRGMERLASQDLEAARRSLQRAEQLSSSDDPSRLPLLLTLSAVQMNLKDYAAAEQVLRNAAELEPDAPSVWDNLGQVLWLLDRKDESIAAYKKKLELQGKPAQPSGPI